MDRYLWLIYAGVAGLCWGTYVPLIANGGRLLKSPYGSFLCVGLAYFLIAILFPLGLFIFTGEKRPEVNGLGLSFAALAGVAGALGALCVIFANKAVPQGEDYKLYIAPVIFTLAPILNTVVSLLWHPTKSPFAFGLPSELPGWKFYVGIILAAIGTSLVLMSKPEPVTPTKTASSGTAEVSSAS